MDYRDGSENGVVIKPAARTLIGSQAVPYIYDDNVSSVDVAAGFMKLYNLGPEGRAELGQKAKAYVQHEFAFEKMIAQWDRTLDKTIREFKRKKPRWSLTELTSSYVPPQVSALTNRQPKTSK